jgi:pyruvate/2-oxoglutarate dehydrogenase complex dihydrolipoamide acyltransferase (E2) component
MPTITIKPPNHPSQRFEVSPNRETLTLGRSSKSDVKIDCASVSGDHATIRKLDEGYVLRDLGSTNGTKLNGQKVSEIHLKSGQDIKLGEVIFTFEPDPGSESKGSIEELPPIKESSEAKSKAEPKAKSISVPAEKSEPDTEKDPVVWGLSLMGSGLIIVGFIVLIGMEAIRAIPERGQNFIIGGISLLVAGLLCLGSILFVTGRLKLPKLVFEFGDDDEGEESKPTKTSKKRRGKKRDEDTESEAVSEDGDEAQVDEDLGKAPKLEQ